MKVLYDHQTFTIQNYGGISRYFYEIIRRANPENNITSGVTLHFSNNAYLNKSTYPGVHPFFPGRNFRMKGRIMHAVNKAYSIASLRRSNFDIFHPTYYDPYFLSHLKNKPFVVTFLDMIHERFSDQFQTLAMDKEIFRNKKILLKESTAVIAISESTKNDIIDIYGISGAKIKVIHLGNSLVVPHPVEQSIHQTPYLLFVGNRSYYKNFEALLTVTPDIIKKYNLHIVCAGGGQFNSEEAEAISKAGLNDKIHHYSIDDNILSNLYQHAEAFIFPSLYEGFGIPVLEAFACGCPCILSTGGSLPEVGGNAAFYFNPAEKGDLYDKIVKFLDNEALRTEMIQAGYARLKQFSWDKTFQESVSLYNSI